jgi:diguanylate cyclase (GGDEF)-like protein
MIDFIPRSHLAAARRSRTGGMPHASFILDARGTILGFDEGMEALTGWPAIRVVGQDKDRIRDAAFGPGAALFDGSLDVSVESTTPLRMRTREGGSLDVEVLARRLAGPGDRAQVSVLRVLARSPEEPPSRDGRTDRLTGLLRGQPFREAVRDEIERAGERARPVGLIVVDVDHLRRVNDTFGHAAGDDVLRKLADLIRVIAGDEARLGRLGDDDFAILLPDAGRGEARQVAAALRSNSERYGFSPDDDTPIHVTLSIGAASYPADAGTADELIDRSRDALDEARRLGRNRVWCYLRRPRVPVEVPVFFDGTEGLLVGYTRDLSPSGLFVQTSAPIDIGMRCAFNFPLPGNDSKVHVIGRVVRAVPPDMSPTTTPEARIPGMGVEFERFGGPEDQRAIETFLHRREDTTLRPERGHLSV